MSKVKRGTLRILLLLMSLGVSVAGLLLARHGLIDGDRTSVNIGFYLFFGGMTVVPIGLGIVGNYFIKSDRIHLQQAKLSTLGEKQKEKLLKRKCKMRAALEKHRNSPVRSLLFILLILGAGIAIGSLGLFEKIYPPDPSEAQNSGAFIFVGVLLSIGAVWAIVLVVRKVIRKQWTPEIDLVIAKLDAEILQLEKDLANARPLSS